MAARAKPPLYRTYLLTVWRAQGQENSAEADWRFHLTDPHSGKRYGFTNAAALIGALHQLATNQPPASESE
jgi:hypothetical protein